MRIPHLFLFENEISRLEYIKLNNRLKKSTIIFIYGLVGLTSALPSLLFALADQYAPLWIIILVQIFVYYLITRWVKQRMSVNMEIYRYTITLAVMVPIIAYISNLGADRTIVQSGIVYVLMQIGLNVVLAWRIISRLRPE